MDEPTFILFPVYLDKSPGNLLGEFWRDIPGFETYYQASNLGRIRSLDRIITLSTSVKKFLRGKILSQTVRTTTNILTGEDMSHLGVMLKKAGCRYNCNIRRLVYLTFIDPNLDFKKDQLFVVNVDHDGYNNRADNLKVFTNSERLKRSITRKRSIPYLLVADRTKWKNNTSARPVAQYDLNGKLLAQFKSIREASSQLNLDERGIIYVAKGKFKQWKGTVWKYIEKPVHK